MSTGEVARPWGGGGDGKQCGGARSPQSVRRCLFGPIDHEENLRYVREEQEKIRERDAERWNFDFESERPLLVSSAGPLRYAWEPCGSSAAEGTAEDHREDGSAAAPPAPVGQQPRGVDDGHCSHKDARQSTITEFLRKRKAISLGSRKPDPTADQLSAPKVRRRAST